VAADPQGASRDTRREWRRPVAGIIGDIKPANILFLEGQWVAGNPEAGPSRAVATAGGWSRFYSGRSGLVTGMMVTKSPSPVKSPGLVV
jgi:hypothetical protein